MAVGPIINKGAQPAPQAQAAHGAARQIEAYFLRRVLSEVRGSSGGLLDGGFAGGTFREMLDETLADKMADAGGVGLAPLIERQLAPAGSPPAGSPPSGHPPAVGKGRAVNAYVPAAKCVPHHEKEASSSARDGRTGEMEEP
jgi:Rod binding domain-containing protein